ncbi:MAG: hypothetical protein ABII98_01995, partial [bacterium]
MNSKKIKNIKTGLFLAFFVTILFVGASFVMAGAPSGSNWFQMMTNIQTGNDDTGDAGTGNPDDFNYYYVGQSFQTNIQISSTGTNAANIWVDFDTTLVTTTGAHIGTFYPYWAGQTMSAGRIKSTGYDPSAYHSGTGNFGYIQWTVVKPVAFNYATTTYATFDINVGTIGLTTESNISRDGVDLLQDEEDFNVLLWADTKKPYAQNPSPASGTLGIAVDGAFTFELRDSKNGEGDDSGVGTGVNTTEPPGSITFDDGGGAVSYTPYDSFACSGIWGTNLCNV